MGFIINTKQLDRYRREKGVFFTHKEVSNDSASYIKQFVNPDTILEPFVGEGSLIKPFENEKINFILNDISKEFTETIENEFKGENALFFNENFVTTSTQTILEAWKIPKSEKTFLIYSNPPFGTVSTNKLVANKHETRKKSRNINIAYDNLEEYGKGDLIIPAIGKMIQISLTSNNENSFLAFFSPFGIFCGRKRYNKLLNAILNDFEFIFGKIYSGNQFHNVSKKKPISFSIWKLNKSIKTKLTDLVFKYEDKLIIFKRLQLLNEFWKYDTRKYIRGEIIAQGNDRFNVVAPKMMHLIPKKGGSELVPENLKQSLNIDGIPDELIFGLWSCTVGYRSLTSYPLYMDNAYVHLPDFTKIETQEILALSILSIVITELKNKYTKGKIGFSKENNSLLFGGKKLTQGANYLINRNQNTLVGTTTIKNIMTTLNNQFGDNKAQSNLRPAIKIEIENRLRKIGYWTQIPIPETFA